MYIHCGYIAIEIIQLVLNIALNLKYLFKYVSFKYKATLRHWFPTKSEFVF